MDLRNVRALGEGIMVDVHGHKLSGAAKMTYIVYWFGKMVDDLDPTLDKREHGRVKCMATLMTSFVATCLGTVLDRTVAEIENCIFIHTCPPF